MPPLVLFIISMIRPTVFEFAMIPVREAIDAEIDTSKIITKG
jgi:hypothetical protein